MTRVDQSPAAPWEARLAGALLILVGILNLGLGALSLVSDQVRLSADIAGGIVAAGLLTAAVGLLVARGSRLATMVALTVFGLLLVVQLVDLAQPGGTAAGDTSASPLLRIVVLIALVGSLALAAVRRRRPQRAEGSDAQPVSRPQP